MRKLSMLFLPFAMVNANMGSACAQDVPKSFSMTGESVEALRPFDDAVRNVLKMTGAPGAALAVAHDGRLVMARGYGVADEATGEPVVPMARFRIASVSKPLTAVAVLRLVEGGQLALNDRVVDILGASFVGDTLPDARVKLITVRDLLYHAGGWDRVKSGFDPPFAADRIAAALGKRPPASAADMVRFMLAQGLEFDPGSRQVYSNVGYSVLGRLIEAVTGETYGAYVTRAVLNPIGAETIELASSFREDRAASEVRYHDARRYLSVFPGRGMVPAAYGAFAIETMDAHGGWIAAAPDLVRLLTRTDLDSTVPDLLGRETLKLMLSPHRTAISDTAFYAMGWETSRMGGAPVWFHRGDLPGTTALLVRAGRTEFALLMNGNAGGQENADRILPMLVEAAGGVAEWPDHDLFASPALGPPVPHGTGLRLLPSKGEPGKVDSLAVRAAALDYIEGWYQGDVTRMERAVHPHLAKRFIESHADGREQLTETTALELVQQVRDRVGSGTPEGARRTDVRILDLFQNVASVRVDAHGWIDYLHLGRVGERWVIINVLWENRRRAR